MDAVIKWELKSDPGGYFPLPTIGQKTGSEVDRVNVSPVTLVAVAPGLVKCEYESDPEYDDQLRQTTSKTRSGEPITCETEQSEKQGETTPDRTQTDSGGVIKFEQPFVCNRCGSSFEQLLELSHHVRYYEIQKECQILHEKGKKQEENYTNCPYECNQCSTSFKHLSELTKHVQLHGIKTYKTVKEIQKECQILHEERKKQEEHNTNTNCLYKCSQCSTSFKHLSQWTQHVKRHGIKTYKTVNEIQKELQILHEEVKKQEEHNTKNEIQKECEISHVEGIKQEEHNINNEIQKEFEILHVDGIKQEEHNITNEIQKECEILHEEGKKQEEHNTNTYCPYECSQCSTSFNHISEWSKHVQLKKCQILHEKGKKQEEHNTNTNCLYKCNKCSTSFKHLSELTKHVQLHRIKTYKTKNEIHKECQILHEEGKKQEEHNTNTNCPYECNQCSTSFKHLSEWSKHVQLHGIKTYKTKRMKIKPSKVRLPYRCSDCRLGFRELIDLSRHTRNAKGHSREYANFECAECRLPFRGFRNVAAIKDHIKNHAGKHPVDVTIEDN